MYCPIQGFLYDDENWRMYLPDVMRFAIVCDCGGSDVIPTLCENLGDNRALHWWCLTCRAVYNFDGVLIHASEKAIAE